MENANDEKLLEIKNLVYGEISHILSRKSFENSLNEPVDYKKSGCGGVVFTFFAKSMLSFSKKKEEEYFKFLEFSAKADEIIERKKSSKKRFARCWIKN